MTLSTLPKPNPIDMSKSLIARTGRVEAWMNNPEGRKPVSCTVFSVEDSFEDKDGLDDSFRFVSHALRYGAGCAVHLSKLRPKGAENGKGLTASGPCSFATVYSTLNSVIRRGGLYKNGAITVTLDANHPDIRQFCEMSRAELPWAKRCINLSAEWWNELAPDVQDLICSGIAAGDLWLAKPRWDQNGRRLFSNVCLEIWIFSRATCLLSHVNLGACEANDLVKAFTQGMTELCELHGKTGVDEGGEYLPSAIDRQVGLGVLGFANFLSLHGVTYSQFADAIELHQGFTHELMVTPEALRLVKSLQSAIDQAAEIAKQYRMDRAFCIAPTASCSYRYTDREGFTTTPEIAPPINRLVDRDSATFGVMQVDYGNVETAEEVTWNTWNRVADGIVRMFQSTELFHGYSYNTWSDAPEVKYTSEFIENWLTSPQTSMYYSLQVMAGTQTKDSVEGIDDDFVFDFSDTEDESCSTDEPFCSSCAE
jgi:hypothetical protein